MHEPSIGASDEWYTPPDIFRALNLKFNLDPCAPSHQHWVPAHRFYVLPDDGLALPWEGCVFLNPPFGGRNGHVPWLRKFFEHGNGVAIVRAYTSSGWWHDLMPQAHAICFPRGKTQFIRPDGSVGKAPGHGVALVGMGDVCCAAIATSGLGMVWNQHSSQHLTPEP